MSEAVVVDGLDLFDGGLGVSEFARCNEGCCWGAVEGGIGGGIECAFVIC